jgi:hypothetical protein
MRLYLITFFAVVLAFQNTAAQRIRKDHREMTPSEKRAYVQALNATSTEINAMADHHSNHFNTEIHTTGSNNGTQFLPWHRVFQLEFEETIRAAGTPSADVLTVPYWDWRVENSTVTWDDDDFLALSKLNWVISRNLSFTPFASNTDISNLLLLSGAILPSTWSPKDVSSPYFSKRLERYHDLGHVFVSGTMNTARSPADPVFYLHHGFVDKLWQEWEDRDNPVQSVFNYTSLIHDYSAINPNNIVDSRRTQYPLSTGIFEVDVWYAHNRKLLLDGLAGDFNVTGTGKVYSYTPWNASTSKVEGDIFAGDVMRNSTDVVVADNKGGFVIKAGADCTFKAGANVVLRPGFRAEAGSEFRAHIVDVPYGFTSASSVDDLVVLDELPKSLHNEGEVTCYPNPITEEFTIAFQLENDADVSYTIFNSLGQPIAYKARTPYKAGSHSEKLNSSSYPSGIYILKFKAGIKQSELRLIK